MFFTYIKSFFFDWFCFFLKFLLFVLHLLPHQVTHATYVAVGKHRIKFEPQPDPCKSIFSQVDCDSQVKTWKVLIAMIVVVLYKWPADY
jgi:hypothetical protein